MGASLTVDPALFGAEAKTVQIVKTNSTAVYVEILDAYTQVIFESIALKAGK